MGVGEVLFMWGGTFVASKNVVHPLADVVDSPENPLLRKYIIHLYLYYRTI